MTINLYVSSTQEFSGKSAVCVALMRRMQRDGYKIGYFKPFSSAARVLAESSIDEDARFIKETFHLSEPLETLAPVVLTNQHLREYLTKMEGDYSYKVKKAATTVGKGKDVVVMEGAGSLREGYIVDLSPIEIANLVDARVVAVVSYRNSLQVVDDILTTQVRMKERLVGVIINSVPANRLDYIDDLVTPYIERQGVNLLAVLPYQKGLHAIKIDEIVTNLEGRLLCDNCGDERAENLVVASMGVEHAVNHFRRVTNKVVIVGGDRPDIQLAALETSTKALILTGNMRPNPMIEAKAEERDVAIILSHHDTLKTVERVEHLFGKSRFHQADKIARFEGLLNKELDFDQFYQRLGLKEPARP